MADDDATFRRMVAYFWYEKEDPTRYAGWDEARCQRLMPYFHAQWKLHEGSRQSLNRVAREIQDEED